MKFGVCYYPEHWPEPRWAEDARWLRELGISIVRMAEFAWAALEPAEGRFEFGWLDRAVATFAAEGHQVVLGTPTAAPPAWLSRGYPDTLPVDEQGRQRNFGGRRHYCPNSVAYQAHTRRIVTALVERYGLDSRVIGWQIDNEFGGGHTARCYCPTCGKAFRGWLQRRYGTLEALNQAWGSVFWSTTYSDWGQIDQPILQLASPNPSHVLDYDRFCSDSIVAYQQNQVELIRAQARDGQFVTHNFMGLYPDLDYFDLAAPLDLATWDSYPTGNADRWREWLTSSAAPDPVYAYDVGDPLITGMAHDLTRGLLRRPFWIMEQQPGHVNWGVNNQTIRPGTVRLWTWHALASGADAVVYFRERAVLYAQEQYHAGLLHHDGTPDVGFHDLERMRSERQRMDEIAGAPVTSHVALLFDYGDLWAIQLQPHRRGFNYLGHLFTFYAALRRLGLNVDIISWLADWSPYKLVLAPTAHLATADRAAKLARFVSEGGLALLGIRTGFKTSTNKVTNEPLPGPFRQVTGATVMGWHSLPPDVSYDFESKVVGLTGSATMWAEALQLDGAAGDQVLAAYTSGPLSGQAALTSHPIGAGQAFTLGWYPTGEQAKVLMAYLAERAGLEPMVDLPEGLIAAQRGPFMILLNFTDAPLSAQFQGDMYDVGPRDVAVLSSASARVRDSHEPQ